MDIHNRIEEMREPDTYCELCDKLPTHYDDDLGCWFCDDHREPCDHPVHTNPGLVAPCPKCGADDAAPEGPDHVD